MRKMTLIVLLCLLLCAFASAESALTMEAPEGAIHPGKAVTISFTAPEAGTAEVLLKDQQGQTLSVVVEDFAAAEGTNILWWNGTYQGVFAPEGQHQLVVNMNGKSAAAPVTIGKPAPYLTHMEVSSQAVTPAVPVTLSYYASTEGTLTVGLLQEETRVALAEVDAVEGAQSYLWDTSLYTSIGLQDGPASLTLMLTDATGFSSSEEHLAVTLSGFTVAESTPTIEPTAQPTLTPTAEPDAEEVVVEIMVDEDGNMVVDPTDEPEPTDTPEPASLDDTVFTPSYGSPYAFGEEVSYWNLPMDITDEAAVWEVLMQPMTILYANVDKAERTQVILRAEPSEDSEGVGMVTRMNQGVRVIETLDNGWSLIECYSSSFKSSSVKRWNVLVQGYVETKALKTIEVQQEYGMVVDKLAQRLYIFKEGKLFTTLAISTGLVNETQPFNETRSGEYVLTSPVGDFWSGNMLCNMGLRFNSGDLLHEVPHIPNADDTKNYGYTEPLLGQKASHGCIRVQRRKTPEGVNMSWLWNNRIRNTKLLIWEDWQGRQLPIPEDDFQLYYNPNGGEKYHSSSFCYMAPKRTFEPFNYSQLEEAPYNKLERCDWCCPERTREEIEKINAIYAPGGDHNALLTRLQEEQIAKEEKNKD